MNGLNTHAFKDIQEGLLIVFENDRLTINFWKLSFFGSLKNDRF